MLLLSYSFDIPSTPSGALTLLRLASSVLFVIVYLWLLVYVDEGDGRCVRTSGPV